MNASASDVFLSYKAEDRARLRPLVAALEADGFSVWWDARISGGSNWRRDIEEHLTGAKCVIVAWSKRSIGPEGEFVRDEASRARRLGTYLPIRIDSVEPPLGFGEIQALPLGGWKGATTDQRYRALVAAIHAKLEGASPSAARSFGGGSRVSRRTVVAGASAVTAAAAAGGAWLWFKPTDEESRRIAVMPFANLSGEPKDNYFSEGLSEEVRSALSRVGFEVIGRDSTDAVKSLDSRRAAGQLHVANILTGSVRATNETVRVEAQLIRGSDGVEKWSQSYDRRPGDAIHIQSDIAQSVAQALSVALGGAARKAIDLGGTRDAKAERLYLQARQVLRQDSSPEAVTRAMQLADSALARDPRFARAFVAKAELLATWASNYVFTPEGVQAKFGEAESAARQALAIAPQLGAGEAVLADIKAKTLDLVGALRHSEAALSLTIDDPNMLWPVIDVLAYTLDPARALGLTARAISLDPLSGRGYAARAGVLAVLRRYPQALAAARKAIELAPKLLAARYNAAQCLALTGHYAEANAVMSVIPPQYTFRRLFVAIGAARTHDVALAERTLTAMRAFDGEVSNYQYAQINAQLNRTDAAFAALDQAYRMRDPGLERLKTDAFLDPLRSDSRFAGMLKKLRFPDA
jgi:TolB-like protein